MRRVSRCLLLGGILGFAVNQWAEEPPMVAVGKADAPVLDGKLDDSAWRNAASVQPFRIQNGTRFAREATVMKAVWDERFLYVGFTCTARALLPEENRLSAFKAEVRENDGENLLKDDCVLLLLGSADGTEVYEFSFNANGMLLDARCRAPQLWTARDIRWNSGAKVAAAYGPEPGRWSAEIAIPWEVVGGRPDKRSSRKFALGRYDSAGGEKSGWPGGNQGWHDWRSPGEMKLVERVAGFLPEVPGAPAAGNGVFSVKSTSPGETFGLLVRTGTTPSYSGIAYGIGTRLPFYLGSGSQAVCQFEVLDQADLNPLFRTPVYEFQIQSTPVAIQCNGARVFINGTEHHDGKSFLQNGMNVIAVESGSGALPSFAIGPHVLKPDNRWKYCAAPEPHWQRVEFDDAHWANASALPEKGCYRVKLLVKESMLWPDWGTRGTAMNCDGLQTLFFAPKGVQGLVLDDYTFYFDLPEDFSAFGADSFYGKFPLRFAEAGRVAYHGRKYRRYAVTIAEKTAFSEQPPGHHFIVFAVGAPAAPGRDGDTIYYHCGSRKAAVLEVPNPLPIKFYPKLAGKQPAKYAIYIENTSFTELRSPDLLKKVIEHLARMGCTGTAPLPISSPSLHYAQMLHFANWNFSCREFVEQHPELELIDIQGHLSRGGLTPGHSGAKSSSNRYVCPTAIVNDPAFLAYCEKKLPEWHQKFFRPDYVNFDYEEDVFEGYLACFCPRCLAEFAAFAKLSGPPQRSEIRSQYAVQWTAFMNHRAAQVARVLRNAVRKVLPGKVFMAYSGYQNQQTKRIYGVDWALLAPEVDLAACGYGRIANEVAATREAVGKTPLMTGAIVYPYRMTERRYPDMCSKARLLRRACDANGGILIYHYPSLDGRSFDAVAAVSRLIANHEPFFIRSETVRNFADIPGFPAEDVVALTDGKQRYLLMLLNQSQAARSFSLNLPQYKKLLNATDGQVLQWPVQGHIAPGDFCAFLLE